MTTPTSRLILLRWLFDAARHGRGTGNPGEALFHTGDLEAELPAYGRDRFGKVHTAGNYGRRFRELRKSDEPAYFGIASIAESTRQAPGLTSRSPVRSRPDQAWRVTLSKEKPRGILPTIIYPALGLHPSAGDPR